MERKTLFPLLAHVNLKNQLGRPVSEYGSLCHGGGAYEGRDAERANVAYLKVRIISL